MKNNESVIGAYMAIGAGMGTALGVAMDNIAIGVALGVGLGLLAGALIARRNKNGQGEGDPNENA